MIIEKRTASSNISASGSKSVDLNHAKFIGYLKKSKVYSSSAKRCG
jgi:hypothetical protein